MAEFAPKGGMCMNCIFINRKCDHLSFSKMMVIEKCKSSLIKIVKCDEFKNKLAHSAKG